MWNCRANCHRMQPCNRQLVLRSNSGFAGAALPFSDNTKHGGEIFPGEIGFGEVDLTSQAIIIRVLEALTFHRR